MEETLYRIVFNGETIPGLTAQQIVEAFAKRFQVREEKAREILLSGGRTVLKRNLDQHKAQRYSTALQKVGLLVVMEPQNPVRFGANLSVELNPSIDIAQSELASAFYDAPPPAPRAAPAPEPAPADQRAGPGLTQEWPQCPKCGDAAVSPLTGVCQSCGVVVERYLARRNEQGNGKGPAPARADNPYAPPVADLRSGGAAGAEAPGDPGSVSAGRAWHWITEGFSAFRQAPGAWVAAAVVFILINGAVNLAHLAAGASASPFGIALMGAASLVGVILGELIIGGLMIGLDRQRRGLPFTPVTVFQGFATAPGPLALLGLTYFGSLMLIVAVATGAAIAGGGLGPGKALAPAAWLAIAVAVLGFLVTWMMFTFAPALVAVGARSPTQALAMSLRGCLRNLPAGLTYWALWALVGVGLTLGFTLAVMALSLLVSPQSPVRIIVGLAMLSALFALVPVLFAALSGSIYSAYRDIYHR